MKFWDTSAIITLITEEPSRERLLEVLSEDPEVLIWWGTSIEVAAALARRERERVLTAQEVEAALDATHQLVDSWHEIVPSAQVRRTAERLLRLHALRASDSVQLAAAVIASDHDPATLEVVCLDTRLAAAARREGFRVVGA